MKASSIVLLGVILAATALVLAGCTQYSAQPSPSPSAQPSLVPETSQGSGSMASPSASPTASSGSDGAYLDDSASQDVDSTGSDVEDLEDLSDDLSAGDVEYSEAG